MAVYLYSDNRIIALTRSTRLQQDFDTLIYIFDLVGLRTNLLKTVRMACRSCCALGGQSAEAYGIQMTGGGSFWYRLRQRVQCPDCGVDLVARSLESHQQFQHGVSRWGAKVLLPTPPLGGGQDVSDLVPAGSTRHHMPSGRLLREGNEKHHTLGVIISSPLAVHVSYPGGGDQSPPKLPQV